jgi:hypothetical protein
MQPKSKLTIAIAQAVLAAWGSAAAYAHDKYSLNPRAESSFLTSRDTRTGRWFPPR